MSCNVCVETFNKSTHQKIACGFCDFNACKKCCETYLLQSHDTIAHCMNCKNEWSRKMLVNKFSGKFINNDFKKHQEEILFQREQALLPETQHLVEAAKQKQHYQNMINKCKEQMSELFKEIKHYESLIRNQYANTGETIFVKRCSNVDCRGFLNSQWKCGLCEMWTCSDCHEVKGKETNSPHTCLEANIEMAKFLAKDTKSCPKCGVLIHKIEGCQQMWCTQCHTTFDWKSGRIEMGAIHNPHYIEWLRKNGKLERNPLDIQCGREIDHYFLIRVNNLHKRKKVKEEHNKNVLEVLRRIVHIRHVDARKFTTNQIQDNQSLRFEYLMNMIDEATFKKRIQIRYKEFHKKREIHNILGMFVTSATDIFYRYVDSIEKNEKMELKSYHAELSNLKNYVNECLQDVSQAFNCKKYHIDGDLKLC